MGSSVVVDGSEYSVVALVVDPELGSLVLGFSVLGSSVVVEKTISHNVGVGSSVVLGLVTIEVLRNGGRYVVVILKIWFM